MPCPRSMRTGHTSILLKGIDNNTVKPRTTSDATTDAAALGHVITDVLVAGFAIARRGRPRSAQLHAGSARDSDTGSTTRGQRTCSWAWCRRRLTRLHALSEQAAVGRAVRRQRVRAGARRRRRRHRLRAADGCGRAGRARHAAHLASRRIEHGTVAALKRRDKHRLRAQAQTPPLNTVVS